MEAKQREHWLRLVRDVPLNLGATDNASIDLYEAAKDMEQAIDQRRDIAPAFRKLRAALADWEECRSQMVEAI